MLATPWICRSCIRALAKPRSPPLAFFRRASTDASASLPPALLQRARKLRAEHDQLEVSQSENFDPKTARRIGELSSVVSALSDWEAAQSSVTELTTLLSSPDAELRQLASEELSTTQTQLSTLSRQLSVSLTPKDPFAHMPCLLEIRPGPGGLESRFFADSVFKMYKQYCAYMGYRAVALKYEMADGAGSASTSAGEEPLQEAVLEIKDAGAYGLFRGEAGMHRVQRVPDTERSGRTHTSAVAVWVLPSFPDSHEAAGGGGGDMNVDDPASDFYLDPAELRIETMRARGAGGQHVNKTESAIRMTHLPTGTVVSMQDSRQQSRNREDAWKLMRSRVALLRREAREEQAARLRDNVLAKHKITRGDKIRTYNYSQDRCTDHRSGVDVHNLPDVLVGGESLHRIVDSARTWLATSDIAAMMAEEESKAAAAAAAAEGGQAASKSKK
ncbi:putative peptide chain release factor 1 like protein [Verticillium longisporum]|uniref:Putative peptide chain release factor 1 like protein n=1 Tax=Verticillium longisporum TaxID=100787 RepID=A0A8I2ZWR1_VERLO|nr:putative peptide chain release factor 1 like protein [Verticillium longisporum]